MAISDITNTMINAETGEVTTAVTNALAMLSGRLRITITEGLNDGTDQAAAILAKNLIISKRNPDLKIILWDNDVLAFLDTPSVNVVVKFSTPGKIWTQPASSGYHNP